MIHILLITGAMVFFIVAWNNGFFAAQNENHDFAAYMLTFVAKLAAFGVMTLFWGLYSSLYRRHLEAIPPDDKIYRSPSPYINVWRGMMLVVGLVVFALALLLKN